MPHPLATHSQPARRRDRGGSQLTILAPLQTINHLSSRLDKMQTEYGSNAAPARARAPEICANPVDYASSGYASGRLPPGNPLTAPPIPLASPKEASATLQAPRHGMSGFDFGLSRLSEAMDWPGSGPALPAGGSGSGGGAGGPLQTGGQESKMSSHLTAWADLNKGASLGPTYCDRSSFHMSTGLGLGLCGPGGVAVEVSMGLYAASPRAPNRSTLRTAGFLPSGLPLPVYSPRGQAASGVPYMQASSMSMGPPLALPMPMPTGTGHALLSGALSSPTGVRARRMRLAALARGQGTPSMAPFLYGGGSEEEGEGLRSPKPLHAQARGAAGHMAYMPAGASLGSSGGSLGVGAGRLLQASPTDLHPPTGLHVGLLHHPGMAHPGHGHGGHGKEQGSAEGEEEGMEEGSSDGRADSFASTLSSGVPAPALAGSKRGRDREGEGGVVTPPRPAASTQHRQAGVLGTPATAAAAGALSVLKSQGGSESVKRRKVTHSPPPCPCPCPAPAVSPLLAGLLSSTASQGYSRQVPGMAVGKGSSQGKLHPWELATDVSQAVTVAAPSAFAAHSHSSASPRPRHGLPPPLPQGKKGTPTRTQASQGSSSSQGAPSYAPRPPLPALGWEAESLPRATQLLMAQARAAFPTAFHGPVEQEAFPWSKYGLGDSRKAYTASDIAGLKGCLSLLEGTARATPAAHASVYRRIGGYTIGEGRGEGSRQERLAAWSVRRAARNWSKEAMVRYPHRAGVVARRVREQGRFS